MFPSIIKNTLTRFLLVLSFIGGLVIAGCNKDLEKAEPVNPPVTPTGPTIADLLNDPNYSILRSAVVRAGMMPMLSDRSLRLTVFAPDNAAFAASGISAPGINAMPVSSVASLVGYHVVPQLLPASSIPTSFPNLQYPTMVNPAPAVSSLLRLTTFPSKRGATAWVNNIPILATDIAAANGLLHKTALVVAPPNQFLWERISTDPNLTYLKAAIVRADSGLSASGGLQGYLSNIGANFTVFAPNNTAFVNTLTLLITQALIQQGFSPALAQATAASLAASPDIFKNPLLFNVMTAQTVQGILAYHILGSRVFSVNIPSTEMEVLTLLKGALPIDPKLKIKANFSPQGVTAATVKGVGNLSAANVLINPLPSGTSDQHYLNGVLHVIDQVLLPQ